MPKQMAGLFPIGMALLRDFIINGKPNTAMPPFKILTGQDVDALVRHIKTAP